MPELLNLPKGHRAMKFAKFAKFWSAVECVCVCLLFEGILVFVMFKGSQEKKKNRLLGGSAKEKTHPAAATEGVA